MQDGIEWQENMKSSEWSLTIVSTIKGNLATSSSMEYGRRTLGDSLSTMFNIDRQQLVMEPTNKLTIAGSLKAACQTNAKAKPRKFYRAAGMQGLQARWHPGGNRRDQTPDPWKREEQRREVVDSLDRYQISPLSIKDLLSITKRHH